MIVFDPASAVPPSEQIRTQLADLIRDRALSAGQRLPSIRQLAADLRVAPGTVARAYSLLESEGLVETGRARGTVVRPGTSHPERLRTAARRFIEESGVGDLEQAISAVRAAWLAEQR